MKAQAAVEFLTTYGWALAAVLVILAALAFIGLDASSIFAREGCSFGAQLPCVDFELNTSAVSFIIQNGYGDDILVLKPVPTIGPPAGPAIECPVNSIPLARTQTTAVTCMIDPPLDMGSRERITLIIPIQRNAGGPIHNVTGYVHAKTK